MIDEFEFIRLEHLSSSWFKNFLIKKGLWETHEDMWATLKNRKLDGNVLSTGLSGMALGAFGTSTLGYCLNQRLIKPVDNTQTSNPSLKDLRTKALLVCISSLTAFLLVYTWKPIVPSKLNKVSLLTMGFGATMHLVEQVRVSWTIKQKKPFVILK